MTEVIWPVFLPSEVKLKDLDAAFGICETSEASIHNLAKAQPFLKSPDNLFTPRKIPNGQGNCYTRT